MKKRVSTSLLSLVLLLTLLPMSALAEGESNTPPESLEDERTFDISEGEITISVRSDGSGSVSQDAETTPFTQNEVITLTGTGSENDKIRIIAEDVNVTPDVCVNDTAVRITLDNLSLSNYFLIGNAKVDIFLTGTNTISSGLGAALNSHLYIKNSAVVSIDGTGSLTCTGYSAAWDGTAGITVSNYKDSNKYPDAKMESSLYINGGTITATAMSSYGAGIGTKWYEPCGLIVINGGTVNATGGQFAAGIGGGEQLCTEATVIINGGHVTATGGKYASAIGTGMQTAKSRVEIHGGTVVANAGSERRGETRRYSYAIGVGSEVGSYSGAEVIIDGGAIYTTSPMLTHCSNAKNADEEPLGGITFSGLPENAEVSSFTVDEMDYGTKDALTNGEGELEAWLPIKENVSVELVCGGNTYQYQGDLKANGKITFSSGTGYALSPVIGETTEVTEGSGEYVGSVEKWTSAITFDPNGGELADGNSVTIEEGKALSTASDGYALPTPTKEGATFVGWNTAADGSGQPVTLATVPAGSTTYYAIWGTSAGDTHSIYPIGDQTYTGSAIEPTVYLVDESGNKFAATGVTYENNTNVGEATAKVTVSGNEYSVKFTINKATPTVSISADKDTITGGGTVKLTLDGVPSEGSVAVTCNDEAYNPALGEDGKYSVTLPNKTESYTFTATYTGEEGGNYNDAEASCIVNVTYKSTSSGSSSGSSSTTTTTVKNPDGSTTTTVTNKRTGTVTVTTKFKDGSTLAVETKKDGTVTTTETRADKVEVKTVAAPDKAVTANVTLPKDVKTAAVTIPADVDYGVVAVNAKTGEIVKLSVPTEDGMLIKLDASAELVLEDRSRDFIDTPNHWAEDNIDFAVAHGMFNGTTETTFAPESPMTRAMLMTVLARFDGQNTDGGATWFEKGMAWAKESGVSDGTNPDGSITREQLATMLYRYAGSPAVDGKLDGFTDAGQVSGYAADAMAWAVSTGIIGGMGDGTLAPQNNATRAQVATMLMRFVTNLVK